MPKIPYEKKKFSRESQDLIEVCDEICARYARKGLDMTLRQLYYQLVKANVIPNEEKSYKRIGTLISDARRAGLIDWNHIIDRTRNLRQADSWDDPADIVTDCASSYRVDRWEGQETQVEAWVEKDALVGVIARAADPFSLPYFACRGYCSDSEMWSAAMRIRKRVKQGRNTLILHLGDHDPSGIDMTRDIGERLILFSNSLRSDEMDGGSKRHWIDISGHPSRYFQVRRIALTMDQIREYQPPPNPAKTTDARFASYQDQFGDESWELDALDPETIMDLIVQHVEGAIDAIVWRRQMSREETGRALLEDTAARMRDEA